MAYTHILVPTDFSETATQALNLALEEAELHRAKVTLVHLLHHEPPTEVYHAHGAPPEHREFDVEIGSTIQTPQPSPPHAFRRDHIEEARTHLRGLVPISFTGSYEVEVATGNPAEEIVQMARDRKVDLIVMGTHGRTGLRHLLLGSVAENVLRHAPCPMLMVRQTV